MKRSADESDVSEVQRRKTARSLNFALQRHGVVERFARSECNGDAERDLSTTTGGNDVKNIMRKKLLQKKIANSAEVTAKADGLERLERWYRDLKSVGFNGELTSLTSKHSPFKYVDPATIPARVLVLYPSDIQSYDVQVGPFQPVRLLIHVDGAWSLQSPILEHTVITSGQLVALETSLLIELAKGLLHGNHTLCPGLLEDFSGLGYVPENVRVMGGPVRSVHANSCKIWHIPSQNIPSKSEADPRLKRVCAECRELARYLKKRVKAKKNVDEATRFKRQMPNSHFPWKFLSPGSKSKRARNLRQQRSRAIKQVMKFYKKTKVELPGNQSKELCELIEVIESSEAGKMELSKIVEEGNKFEGKRGLKAGDCVSQLWRKDREEFFKDQQNNVTTKKGNRWSLATIRVALAVYNRSPSAYEAVRDLNILQLPCTKVLKKILKNGAEDPGVDHSYFEKQQKKFQGYQQQRESDGYPLPLGIGVLMWDEVKVQMKVAWNLKGGGISGFTMAHDELPVLHDVYSSAIASGCQKTSYIVQFLWRELTSGYDVIGPYFSVPNSMDSNMLQEFFMLCLKAFTAYGFRVAIVLCDGASSNLTLLKILCGYPRATLPINYETADVTTRYFVNMSFTNPEDPSGNPIFAMICPSHQLKNMIAALYSSRWNGSKKLTLDGIQFGWGTIEKIYAEEMQRAERGTSRKVPGLKYAFVYRDNWTRLNVRPAKIMQQRYMIAAIQDLAEDPNQESAKPVASFLEGCNLIFENGLLSSRRVRGMDSPVIRNIKKGMAFFEKWCHSHEQTVYPDNSKKSRQSKFLAWQTWDLLRVVAYGFLSFCEWFFATMSPNSRYFISPLRINGSALESIFSVLKHTCGGNLSAISYSPALGRLINRKGLTQNKYSEKGYRDITLNISGESASTQTQISILCTIVSSSLSKFIFPSTIAQSSLAGRQGSNACTIIAVKFGAYFTRHKLHISLLWKQLPQLWVHSLINAICDGNDIYDELYGDTAVLLDVEDVVQSVGAECNVDSVSAIFGFTDANNYADLVDHVSNVQQPSYGILIGCQKSVGILVQANGLCALIDSHVHGNSGAIILMAKCPSSLITAYSRMLHGQNLDLTIGTFTWVQYRDHIEDL